MKLFAISDLHVDHGRNREALQRLGSYPDDWLILAGDVANTPEDLDFVMVEATRRFARVFWVPGNHELWSVAHQDVARRGAARYDQLVDICRRRGVVTPEDPYVVWEGDGGPCLLVPLFLLYDYSFRPERVAAQDAVAWAIEGGVVCADEELLKADPYASAAAWCAARCHETEARLQREVMGRATVLINHFPLRYDLVRIPLVPRFTIWCGTSRTEAWHLRFGARVVVSGHLHVRATDWRDGVRLEEVSLGYPRQWTQGRGLDSYLREIFPGPPRPPTTDGGPVWHRE
jgi:predicted phosphodiesterase